MWHPSIFILWASIFLQQKTHLHQFSFCCFQDICDCDTLQFSFCLSNTFHTVCMDQSPFSSELSSLNPGDGRQTPEPTLEPQEPPESKLKPKAQAGKHCMIRILIMRTFHNLRTSPEPALKAADPEPNAVEKRTAFAAGQRVPKNMTLCSVQQCLQVWPL